MSRRNGRTRRSNNVKEQINKNKLFNKIILILIIIVISTAITIVFMKKSQNEKIAIEKEKIRKQQSEIFQSTNAELESLEDYKSNSLIRISAVGDILCGSNLQKYGTPYEQIFDDVRKKLKNTDLTLGTYETDVNDSKKDFASSIKNAGINFASLAHNHALDYGQDGLNEINEYLTSIGMKTVGIYAESSEERVKIFEKKGVKIAILAYTYDNGEKGVNIYKEDIVKSDLEYANQNANFSIVMMHWGDVNKNEISSQQEEQAKFLVENGANIIIGAHPSVVQKMEVIKNENGEDCFVGYSLGDFSSDFENENANLELILNIQVYVDTEGKAMLYKVDYTPIYMIDKGHKLKENRFKILDIRAEIEDYGMKQDSVSEDTYNKLIRAADRLNDIIIKNE